MLTSHLAGYYCGAQVSTELAGSIEVDIMPLLTSLLLFPKIGPNIDKVVVG
jgi:hypothetical protein